MQIFTLGKMRIPLFFFALFFMTGTYMYGQSCPTVEDELSSQSFCDTEEPTFGSLEVSSGSDVVWYASEDATQPFGNDEFIPDGINIFYAGSSTGQCSTRPAVTVTVFGAPRILGIYENTMRQADPGSSLPQLNFCVEDVNDSNLTLADIRTSADNSGKIIWYADAFQEEVLTQSTELVNGTTYWVGQEGPDGCISSLNSVEIILSNEPAPTGDEAQEFCAINNPTLADIVATGNNRYYTAGGTRLASTAELVDGRTYYVSSVGSTCESFDRLAVTVTVTPAVELETTGPGIVCELDVQETFPSVDAIENYYLSLLGEEVPTNGTFNPTPAQMATQYQNDNDGLGDFTTTYTVGCDQVDLTISVIASEEANAGQDVSLEFAIDDETQNLYSFLTSEAQTFGTFEGYPDGLFDPSQTGAGVYTVTYTVDETSGCISGEDSAIFTITVAPCEANAGEDVNETFCRTEIEALVQQIINAQDPESQNPDPTAGMEVLAEWLGDRDLDGTFEGDFSGLQQFIFPGNPLTEPVIITGTYTVGEGECEDTAAISITVIEDANAGNDNTITLSPDDAPVDLFTLLGENAQTEGTWSSGNGTFNPATDAAGTYTYIVGTDGCTDSASVVVTLTTDSVVSPGVSVVCLRDVQTFFPSVDEIRKYYLRLLPSGVATNGSFNPTPAQMADIYQADEDGLGEFTTTYTVNGESYELTINVVTEAEAGDDATITLTTDDEPVDLFTYLGENALRGGTWSNGNGTFDPATDEAGTFTYTVGYETCMDSATVTVIVNDPTDPTTPGSGYAIVCAGDVDTFFPSYDEIRKFYLRLLPTGVATNGTFNPTPRQISEMYQADADKLGEFTTVYTAPDAQTYELTVNVVAEAFAGDDATVTLTTEDDEVTLFEYLGENAQQGGTWSNGDGTFDPATDEPGTFTYTVGYEGCMDSATVTVTVSTDPCTGIVDAGTDSSADVCETDVQTTFPSIDEIRKFYLGLLDAGVSVDGTFSPTPAEISAMYQADEDGLGDFTTTYTLTNGECTDSVELTVTIVPTEPASTGDINDITTCTAEGTLNLFDFLNNDNTLGGTFSDASGVITDGMLDVSEEGAFTITYTVEEGDTESCIEGSASTTFTVNVTANTANAGADNSVEVCNSEVENLSNAGVRNLYISLLESGVDTNGSFNPTIQEIIDDYNINSKFGDFTTTYTVGTGQCTDSAVLTVTVLENPDAGQNATVNLEEDATETVDLFAELGGTPETGGTWTFDGDEVDATFDPATDAEGVYTYTVTSDNGCSASATVTVIVGTQEPECNGENTPAAPTVTPFDGCAASNATVADLEISGEADAVFTVYSDETLQTEVDATQVLTAKTYYVTQTNTTGCVSDATAVTVTLNDVDAPSLVTEPEQLCAGQDLTVGDLEGSVIANGDLVWYTTATGSETVSPSTPLQNGTTLFAAAVDATTGCESSTRTPVQVNLSNCEIVIPEIFSPNGDAINDRFVIQNISSEYPNHMMEIYNRWGEPVYKGQVGKSQGWDGTSSEGSFGSGVLPVGVYFYILNYNDGQTAPIQGRVYLSR
ncbi:gliding motility-associated C-terminal domain-containing protein [Salinimicrobium sp. MT39]|uniref:Gliding motility-associated C-terminal domain-containing protein n=1 Tax=Salinimicrobium profundisediminis TaxID=2994553 RepID=A0A9X3CYF9_9FLAO|nr:gliding motility-associated C-terminal domain-containing protein [Salinimicrobium profundisediminis]MCX2838908.1 gliding motility-associated C-terminal domain-containing protein [Salinimicrobium profundisediminis]